MATPVAAKSKLIAAGAKTKPPRGYKGKGGGKKSVGGGRSST